MDDKHYIVIGGVNGAGKSTFRSTMNLDNIKVIDIDIIAKQYTKIFKIGEDKANQKAARMGIELFKKHIIKENNILQESTLSGKSFINNIDEAKLNEYKTHLVFIGVKSPELSLKNIANRVNSGGHNIPESVVLRRFDKVYKNLEEAVKKVDMVTILDNSNKDYNLLLSLENGKIKEINDNVPDWIQKSIDNVINNYVSSRDMEKVININDKELNKISDKGIKVKRSKLIDEKKFPVIVKKEDVKEVKRTLRNMREKER